MTKMEHELLSAWSDWEPSSPPFVLGGDEQELSRLPSETIATHCSWEGATREPEFCKPGDTRLHLGLLPQPFFGDMRKASIYILLLNPGLGPTDYYGEYRVDEYRSALRLNLKQQHERNRMPFLFLDPRFSWHGGFDWWHGKLAKVIETLASSTGVAYSEARTKLGSAIASIELLPYHSSVFDLPVRIHRKLRSAKLARAFVTDFVVPRVKRGEATVVVTRQVKSWDLPAHDEIVCYSPVEARAAHLTPDSKGGQAILRRMKLLSSS